MNAYSYRQQLRIMHRLRRVAVGICSEISKGLAHSTHVNSQLCDRSQPLPRPEHLRQSHENTHQFDENERRGKAPTPFEAAKYADCRKVNHFLLKPCRQRLAASQHSNCCTAI